MNMNGKDVLAVMEAISILVLFICIGVSCFFKSDKKQVEWISKTGSKEVIKISPKTTTLIFDESVDIVPKIDLPKHLKSVEFYSANIDIKNLNFSRCKELEEVIFHYVPQNLEPKTFAECNNLKKIYFIEKRSRKNLSLIVPKSCSIECDFTNEVKIPPLVDKIPPVKVDVKIEKGK